MNTAHRGRSPSPKPSSRREFLRAVGVSIASVHVVACGDDDEDPIEPPPQEVVDYQEAALEYFDNSDDFDNAAFIGRNYVRQEGMSSSEAFDSTARSRRLLDDADDNDENLVAALESELHDDFVNLRVRDVRGWTLSRTEVDLCVLAYLLDNLDEE